MRKGRNDADKFFPLNLPTPDLQGGERNSGRATAVPLVGGVRGGFMGPMPDSGIVEAFHGFPREFPLIAEGMRQVGL